VDEDGAHRFTIEIRGEPAEGRQQLGASDAGVFITAPGE